MIQNRKYKGSNRKNIKNKNTINKNCKNYGDIVHENVNANEKSGRWEIQVIQYLNKNKCKKMKIVNFKF